MFTLIIVMVVTPLVWKITLSRLPVPEIMAVSIPEILAYLKEGEPEWNGDGNTILGRDGRQWVRERTGSQISNRQS
jgi:hypothetical protein